MYALIALYNMTLEEAYVLVKSKRPVVEPPTCYLVKLAVAEQELKRRQRKLEQAESTM
jgi:hypothetical protein